jgi:phosphorylcholine metabolism protein LicD
MKKQNNLQQVLPILLVILIIVLLVICWKYWNNSNVVEGYKVKDDVEKCYSNVMSDKEDKILQDLIIIWTKIANELNIRWSICAGTYIGAIRHNGRIPWDDDFDITILEEDKYKLKDINKLLLKYNVSVSKFWGGIKLFFTDKRGIKKFKQYGWNWPFIDIFTLPVDGKSKECFYLQKSELPLKKIKFNNILVNISTNNDIRRPYIKNQNWKHELFDTGYRHQNEKGINKKCKIKLFKG